MAEKEFDLDDLSKNMFMKALLTARERMVSACALSMWLGLLPRRVNKWFEGNLPSYNSMQKVYPGLLEVVGMTEDELNAARARVSKSRKQIKKNGHYA